MSKFRKDMISSLIFLALGIALLFIIPINISDVKLSSIGPRSFPYFIAVSMIVLSILLMIVTYLTEKKVRIITNENSEVVVEEIRENKMDTLRVVIFIVLIFIYIILFEKVGYFISTFLLSTSILLLLKTKNIWSYIIVYLVATGIYLAFTKLLFVILP